MSQIFHYFIIAILLFSLAISCDDQPNEGKVIVHPVEEKIPYSDEPAELLDVHDAGNHLEKFPESVHLLYQVLNEEETETEIVDLNLLTSSDIEIESISDTTLLILDKDQNKLISYNLSKHESETIADQGRGPGDLLFTEELSAENLKAYVSSQNFKITVFNCQTRRCEYEKVIQTDYSAYSLSPTEKYIYYLGLRPYGVERNLDDGSENEVQYSVHRTNINGNIETSFLPIYDDNSPIVSNRIMSEGNVRSFPDIDRIIVTFEHFPYLYIHNLNGELLNKYELPDFKEAKNIESKIGELSTTLTFDGDYSYLRNSEKINNELLLLKIQEFRDVEYVFAEDIYGDTWISYLIYDIENEKIYKIGDDEIVKYGEKKMFYLSDSGLISNTDGKISWIRN